MKISKLVKIGHSHCVIIPSAYIKLFKITRDTDFIFNINKQELVINVKNQLSDTVVKKQVKKKK